MQHDKTYEEGEIVFAKVKCYSWWPGFIREISEKTGDIVIEFIGDNSYAVWKAKNVRKFLDWYEHMMKYKQKKLINAVEIAKKWYDTFEITQNCRGVKERKSELSVTNNCDIVILSEDMKSGRQQENTPDPKGGNNIKCKPEEKKVENNVDTEDENDIECKPGNERENKIENNHNVKTKNESFDIILPVYYKIIDYLKQFCWLLERAKNLNEGREIIISEKTYLKKIGAFWKEKNLSHWPQYSECQEVGIINNYWKNVTEYLKAANDNGIVKQKEIRYYKYSDI